MRKSLIRNCLSILISTVMVVGPVPAPALAEAVETQDEVVIVTDEPQDAEPSDVTAIEEEAPPQEDALVTKGDDAEAEVDPDNPEITVAGEDAPLEDGDEPSPEDELAGDDEEENLPTDEADLEAEPIVDEEDAVDADPEEAPVDEEEIFAPQAEEDAEDLLTEQATWYTWGTCEWSIDSAGKLVVRPKSGSEGTLPWRDRDEGEMVPWYDQRSKIVSVQFQGTVHANECYRMFIDCAKLATANLTGLDTSSAEDMYEMFCDCPNLTSVDASKLNTSSAKDMHRMFKDCPKLASLDVSKWNTSSVTNMSGMFSGCSSLTSLDVSKWNTSKVQNMGDGWKEGTFYGCSSLTSLDVSKWNTSTAQSMASMFEGCSKLASLNVSNWNTSSVTDMCGMFSGCSNLASLNVSNWDISSVQDTSSMFEGCSKITSLGVSNWDTSAVRNISEMFERCSSLTSLDVSKWDTSSVDYMYEVFEGCSKLASLDVSKWNTSSVEVMAYMFSGCASLTSLDVSKWDTTFVGLTYEWQEGDLAGFSHMFNGCSKLTALNLSQWNTQRVTNMSEMFSGCTSLKKVTLGKNFSFNGAKSSRLCSFPNGMWRSTNSGKLYAHDKVPNKVADTYTKILGSVGKATVAKIADQPYTGSAIKPSPKVTLDGKTLKAGTDYTISWSNNVKVGNAAKAVITGKGSYDGKKTVTFRIAFKDVPKSNQFYAKIHRANDLGIINGYSGDKYGQFGPSGDITRGQIAVMLWNAAGKPGAGKGAKSFPDVSPTAYYAKAVAWASSRGVVNGYANGKFGPNDNITREQLAVMVANYARKVGELNVSGSKADISKLPDAGKVSGYAVGSVAWCYKEGILVLQSGSINPKKTADRATAAQMVVDLYDLLY